MRLLLMLSPVIVIVSCVFSDAGFLRSIVQNPIPVSSSPISVTMTSEDVLIEINPGGTVEITAAFLFTNTGTADTVIMYFPLTLRTVFMGPYLQLNNVTDPLSSPSVTVNGLPVIVRPLIGNTWAPWHDEYTWDEVRDVVYTMQETEPDSGEFYFYIADEFSWDTYDIYKWFDEWSSDYTVLKDLLISINSLNACWAVPFSEGDSVLVEFCMEYFMSSEYESPYCTMIYPLYTGASWAGPIGEGRITVVPSGGLHFADFDSWYSISMPDAEIVNNLTYEPLEYISGADGFELTRLAEYSGIHLDSVLVWEFNEFEPVVSPTQWEFFYFTPDNPDGRFHSGLIAVEDTANWSSSIRIDILDPLWTGE